MDIILNQPDKSCWQLTAIEGEDPLGSVIFFPKGDENLFIGYIGLTALGRQMPEETHLGSQLLDSCIEFGQTHDFAAIIGALIPVPGCEHAVIDLFTEHGFEIDRKGNVCKKLGE